MTENKENLPMSVRKREWTTPSGKARTAWVVDYTDQGKKRCLKTFARKSEADAFAAKAATDKAAGLLSSGKTTIAQAGKLWIEHREADGLERATTVVYETHLRLHIAPLIGALRLADLSVPKVRDFEDELRRTGRSPAMVKKVMVSLSSILTDAMDRGLVAQNVARHRRRAKNGHDAARHERHLEIGVDIPALAEIRGLLPCLKGGPNRERSLLLTAIFTGLRASELRGLRWQDVDLAKAELAVRQRADRYNTIGSPKSKSGKRSVPMLPMLVNALKEWRLAAAPASEADLVFPASRGQPLTIFQITRAHWWPAQVRAGLVKGDGKTTRAKYSGFHSLRHFFASWCINRKAEGGLELPLKVVQARLGHASIAITSDRYGHLFPRADDSAEMRAAERAFLTA
jgi:integrase